MTLSNPSVHNECANPCRLEISPQRLLSVLIREFGGEAVCVDLASRMQELPSFKAVDAGCVHCIRGVLAGLCRRGLVKLESMEDDKLLVSVTYDGAASKPGGASAIETLK